MHTRMNGSSPTNTRHRLLTIPNILCMVRLAGAPALVGLALMGQRHGFIGVFLFLALTDWLDGKLAIILNQRSLFGARLDSWADAAMYAALLTGSLLLEWNTLQAEFPWIIPAAVSYAVSVIAGYAKFGRWPSYHTRAAKISWFLITLGALVFLTGWSVMPLRIAMAAVTLTNIEALLITILSSRWQVNVASVFCLGNNEPGEQ